jgi:hypothetical protein
MESSIICENFSDGVDVVKLKINFHSCCLTSILYPVAAQLVAANRLPIVLDYSLRL